jgi:hypothetical protein
LLVSLIVDSSARGTPCPDVKTNPASAAMQTHSTVARPKFTLGPFVTILN